MIQSVQNLDSKTTSAFLSDTDIWLSSLAKTDPNIFIECVVKDGKGKRVIQGQIHKEIHWHIDECERTGNQYCGILAPWGHGKTESCVIGRVLYNIGKDPNLKNAIITNIDDNSKARVSSITKYILYDEDYKKIFPHVKPANNSDWSKHKIIVDRDSKSQSGTVEAWGVTSSGVGGRFDRLFFDDIIDQRNAIANPALREAVKDAFNNVWLSRLSPDGIAIYIATVWHQDDNTAVIRNNPEWKFLVMSVSEDLSCIECESAFKGKYTIPLWDYWNKDKLKQRRSLIGARAFDRGYRQIALSDEDRTFPSSETIFRKDVDLSVVRNDWPRCVGIDPFGQAVVIFVLALDPVRRRRFPIEIRRGKWQPTQTVAQIIDINKKHNPQIVVCENNASQEAIIQWLAQTEGGYDIPVVPFTTGKQKVDPAFGLPSLEIEFANGLWIVPCAHVDENDAEDPVNIWRKELLEHPLSAKEDTVMASWFAREGARYLLREDTDEGEIYTGEDFGVEQVIIGDY